MNKDILKFSTMGSVDDGKSTLIGRLLYETDSIYIDQYDAIEEVSKKRGKMEIDLSLITDGLRAEREQGITIDVAYRYFSTKKRKFIVADGPGHVQYTKNAITGLSHSDISIILIDAKKGITEQSKRHGFITSLLNTGHLLVLVNKMDLVDYSENIYQNIISEYKIFLEKIDVRDVEFIPISALKGDNVTVRSENMKWFEGSTVIDYLENVYVENNYNVVDFRFPVQMVLSNNQNFRGYAGRIESGRISVGDAVIVLPSMKSTFVKKIYRYDEEIDEAYNSCVTLIIEDDIDISRGNMIVKNKNVPFVGKFFDAILCWMSSSPMDINKNYILKHTTNVVNVSIVDIMHKIDINTLHKIKEKNVKENDIVRVSMSTFQDIFFDYYKMNKNTGGFILIDPDNFNTVASGFIKFENKKNVWEKLEISKEDRLSKSGHKGKIIWFTGFSGSGKSTIAKEVEKRLFTTNHKVIFIDGDDVRKGLCSDLGFSLEDRTENIRRIGEMAKMLVNNGFIVLCAFVSPLKQHREFVKNIVECNEFLEIFVDCSIEKCEERDVKGLYKKYREGLIPDLTGLGSIYERPLNPDVILNTEKMNLDECVNILMENIRCYNEHLRKPHCLRWG